MAAFSTELVRRQDFGLAIWASYPHDKSCATFGTELGNPFYNEGARWTCHDSMCAFFTHGVMVPQCGMVSTDTLVSQHSFSPGRIADDGRQALGASGVCPYSSFPWKNRDRLFASIETEIILVGRNSLCRTSMSTCRKSASPPPRQGGEDGLYRRFGRRHGTPSRF